MKILFLARSLQRGGAERQMAALARGLCMAGHTVSVVAFYEGGPLISELLAAGVDVKTLGKTGRWDLVGFLFRLVRLLREEKPAVIHGYMVEPNILTAFVKPFLPGTRVVWGVRASGRDLRQYERFIRLAFRLQCVLSRHADLVIANSNAGRADHVARGFPADRTVVIPNGIDTELFRRDPQARHRVRADLGIGDDQKLIGVVARLDPMKDHPTFLKAAALVARHEPNVRFLCIGDGSAGYVERLRALANDLGIADLVAWSGSRGDIAAVYNSLDLLVSSSCWGEGFSNVIAEAMACETPCVATAAGDSALVVGDTGWVVPPGDPELLARGILALLAEPPAQREGRGRRARARIVSEFSVDLLVERTEKVLLSLPRRSARATT